MKVKIILSVILAGTALRQDMKSGKVPNLLILTGLAAAVILSVHDLPDMAAGALLPMLFPGLLFFFRMIGAGDVKLLCALGAVLGFAASRTLIIRSLGLGAVQALLLILIRGNGTERWHILTEYFKGCIHSGKLLSYTDRSLSGRMHLTVSIFGAVLWYALECLLLKC